MSMDVNVLEKYENELNFLAQLVLSNPLDAKQSALEIVNELRQLRTFSKKNCPPTIKFRKKWGLAEEYFPEGREKGNEHGVKKDKKGK